MKSEQYLKNGWKISLDNLDKLHDFPSSPRIAQDGEAQLFGLLESRFTFSSAVSKAWKKIMKKRKLNRK